MKELVRLVKLVAQRRDVAGTQGYVRDPVVGDTGQVIYEYPGALGQVTVECKDAAGHTLWFADVSRDEIAYLPANGDEA